MPTYRYEAVTSAGETIKGDVQAADQAAVVQRLQRSGHVVLRTDEVKPNRLMDILNRDLLSARKVRQNDIVIFTAELATLVGAGLTVHRALSIMSDAAGSDRVKNLLDRLFAEISGGSSLCDALRAESGIFSTDYLALIEAGEASGSLDVVLKRLANYLERAEALQASIRSALTYPLILLGFAGLTVLLLVTMVLPRFQAIFDDAGQALPFATRIFLASADFLTQWWWLLLILAAAVFLIARQIRASKAGRLRWDHTVLRLPLLGDLVTKTDTARMVRVLGTLLTNGVALLEALSIVGGTLRNAALADAMGVVRENVRDGKTLATAISIAGGFPQLAVQLIHVGDETGKLGEMLVKIADIYEVEVKRTFDWLLALLVPVVTIALGALIAGIIGSVLVAVLRINELAI